tara:strand:- start:3492 stop:3740 length:249 start_codon:yes stop_codon:yes gene_type:complete
MAYKMKGSTFYGKGNQSPLKQKYPSRNKQKQINEKVKGKENSAKHTLALGPVPDDWVKKEPYGPGKTIKRHKEIYPNLKLHK